jgi:hypothetical protein
MNEITPPNLLSIIGLRIRLYLGYYAAHLRLLSKFDSNHLPRLLAAMEDKMAVPPLAIEVADMIIDFLFDDNPTLASVSLVCKVFLPSSRLHLFERLTLRTR